MQFDAAQPATWAPVWLHGDGVAVSASAYVHTTPLTTYESTVALGMRAMELNQNAAPHVYDIAPGASSLDIARMEMARGLLPPMSVLRYLPDGTFVRKSVNDCLRPRRA